MFGRGRDVFFRTGCSASTEHGEHVQLDFEGLPVFVAVGMKDQAAAEHLNRGEGHKAGGKERWEPRYQTGHAEFPPDGDKEDHSDEQKQSGDQAEKRKGTVVSDQAGDGAKDFETVGKGAELGDTAGGSVPVIHGDGRKDKVLVERMDRHFRFNFKALGENGEAFDKHAAECTVSGHDVGDMPAEESVDQIADQDVAGVVEHALVFSEICGGKPVPDDHVCPVKEHLIHHLPGMLCGVGVIPVDHQVAVGINLTEHGADDIAFSLAGLIADNSAGFPGNGIGSVGGIVVIDIDDCLGKGRAVIVDDLGNGPGFIVTGNEHSNAWRHTGSSASSVC